MSLFSKVTALFLLMLVAMSAIALRNIEMEQQNQNSIAKEKLSKIGAEIAKNSLSGKEENGKIDPYPIKEIKKIPNGAEKIFESKTIFADIAVSEQDGALYLSIAYPDEEMHYIYTEQTSSDKRLWGFFALDLTLLVIAYGVLLNFLSPIKKLSKAIEKVADDDFAAMPVASKDEIGKLTESFNQTAVTLRKMLKDREAFAVRAAHELRTPIAKGRIAAEMDNGEYGELYRKIFKNLDIFTDELLKVHKLKNTADIKNEKFSAETVLTAALDRVFTQSEDEITVKFESDFLIDGVFEYAAIIVRNLIENGLKYKTANPLKITVQNRTIEISNQYDINGQNNYGGYGIGLKMCEEIAENFGWKLKSDFFDEVAVFKVEF